MEGDTPACLHGHQCICTGGISLLAGKRAFTYGTLASGPRGSRNGGKLVSGILQVGGFTDECDDVKLPNSVLIRVEGPSPFRG
jgi:hypothetical protein